MRALVLEDGAMRAVFTSGVLDGLAERREPPFDLAIGVSAGACCATSLPADFTVARTTRDPERLARGYTRGLQAVRTPTR